MVQYTENVPEGWSIKQIKDIAPLQRGFDLPSKELVDGEYPVCYSNGVGNFHSEYKVKGPGVFTGRSGTIGNVFFVEEDFWPHNTSLWVTDFKDNDEKYVYYLYQSIKLNRFNAGTGVPTLNRNDVHSHKVLIPNEVVEQKRIADIIGVWDKVIELKEKLIGQKKEQKKGLVQKLLSGKIRLSGFSGKWEIQPIEKVCDLNMGKTPSRNKALYWGKGYSWIAISDMKGKYISKTREQITELAIKESGIKIIPKDTVIMSFKLTIGRLAITKEEMYSNEAIVSFGVKNPEILDSEYLFYYLNSIDVTQYGSRAAKGVTLNKDSLKEIMVKIPPFEEQLEIRKILSNADREIDLLEGELLLLNKQKKALMQQLLTGKIRVKV